MSLLPRSEHHRHQASRQRLQHQGRQHLRELPRAQRKMAQGARRSQVAGCAARQDESRATAQDARPVRHAPAGGARGALRKLSPLDRSGAGDRGASDAIVKICAGVDKDKLEKWTADAATTTKLMQAVANLTGMATKYGQFGIDQQSMGFSSLYVAYSTGSNKKDEALDKLITDKLFP